MKQAVPIFSVFCFAAALLPAQQLLQEAVAAFPAQTVSLEYDALSRLRQSPSYASMRKQYSGEGLQRAQRDLLLLGVSENQLSEVVTGSGPNGFFGLLSGSFHQTAAMKDAVKHGMLPSVLDDGPVFCAKDAVCFLLLSQEEGHALFGNLDQLRAISDVRQGRAMSLRSNTTFMNLLNRMEPESPVFGFAPGKEIGDWIGNGIPPAISSHIDLNRLFSTIENFGYSVKVDSKAHVGLNLLCSSEEAGTVVKDTLSAASGLERAAAMAAGPSAMPFDKMVVQSSGRIVSVNLDAAIQ